MSSASNACLYFKHLNSLNNLERALSGAVLPATTSNFHVTNELSSN